jgi:Mrp family chromosome partitioning ATPase
MTSKGADVLKAAIRRSIPLIIGLVIVGVVAVNGIRQLQGPKYAANARVLVSGSSLSNILTGTQSSFVDPKRQQDTAVSLASSRDMYRLAAAQHPGLGSTSNLKSSTQVASDADTDILTFTASDTSSTKARDVANAVADAYVGFRQRLSASTIAKTTRRLRDALNRLPPGDPQRSALTRQLQRLSVLGSLNTSDATVVERATSSSKTSPAPIKDSLLGFSIGLIVALLVAALREAVDTAVRTEADVEELLATPVLATIRTLPRRARIVTVGRHEAAFADSYALLAAQLVGERKKSDRSLVIAVTSSVSNEGKTTTSSNLAIALARRDTDVLLADFDFRKPALADVFGLPEDSMGALQLMEGEKNLHAALWSVSLDGAQPHASQNGDTPDHDMSGGWLELLPSGGGAVNAKTVAHPARLESLVRSLRGEADVIVLDTPPALLTVEMAELSRLVDVIVVVVRQGRVSQRSLRALRRQSKTWKAEIAGAVVTDATGDEPYGYYRSK